jgi:hypothetical protein
MQGNCFCYYIIQCFLRICNNYIVSYFLRIYNDFAKVFIDDEGVFPKR